MGYSAVSTAVSEERITSIFSVENQLSKKPVWSRWTCNDAFQKMATFITTAVTTSNPTSFYILTKYHPGSICHVYVFRNPVNFVNWAMPTFYYVQHLPYIRGAPESWYRSSTAGRALITKSLSSACFPGTGLSHETTTLSVGNNALYQYTNTEHYVLEYSQYLTSFTSRPWLCWGENKITNDPSTATTFIHVNANTPTT
jgi:hypothetical protein